MFPGIIVGIALLVAVVVGGLWYMGFFQPLVISQSTLEPTQLAYVSVTGPYSQSGSAMDKVYYSLLKNGISTTNGFGVYYDSPQTVEASKLRSIAGCIIPKNTDKPLPADMKKAELSSTRVYTTTFPFKNKLSVMVSLMKVYPALEKYRVENKLSAAPIMEMYDIPNKQIKYYVPVDESTAQWIRLYK